MMLLLFCVTFIYLISLELQKHRLNSSFYQKIVERLILVPAEKHNLSKRKPHYQVTF